MAEFCKQCSIAEFNKDFYDFMRKQELPEGYGFPEICEGCGPTFVDSDGTCIANCDKGHAFSSLAEEVNV